MKLFRQKFFCSFSFFVWPALIFSFMILYFWIFSFKAEDRERIIFQRSKHVRDMCMNISNTDYWKGVSPSGDLFTHEDITYCRIEKAGCTFWLRVMRFLAKDFNSKTKQVLKPSDIGRYQVHYARYNNLTVSKIRQPLGQLMLSTTKSFMFTRHPLTRLWSAYVDKFLLPDFWIYHAVWIANTMRPRLKEKNITCVNDLSFKEFIEYIVSHPAQYLDKHWKPVHLICSPCHTHFDVIGKQETFSSDVAYVIDKFKMKEADEKTDKAFRARDEIDMIVRYNFDLGKIRGHKECHNPLLIAKRLWLAFQQNGYIHSRIEYPVELLDEDKLQHNPSDTLLDVIFTTIDSMTSREKKELKYQKFAMTSGIYKGLSPDLFDRLKEVYRYDFELFSYDPGLFV